MRLILRKVWYAVVAGKQSTKYKSILEVKQPLGIQVSLGFIFSQLQEHVNESFSGQSKDHPQHESDPICYQVYKSVYGVQQSFYTTLLIIKNFLPLKCDQSAHIPDARRDPHTHPIPLYCCSHF